MNSVKILVVEDEFIVAEDVRINLCKSGYEVYPLMRTGEEAIEFIRKTIPDLVVIDIRLGDGMDGISTAAAIHKLAGIPLIFITAHSDKATFERAKFVSPHAYLVKPFNFHNLHAAIELALFNFSQNGLGLPADLSSTVDKNRERPEHYIINETVFIKIGNAFQKVRLQDINYLQARGSYTVLHTSVQTFTLALNLHVVLDRLKRFEFLRVHRSYAVNINNIDKIEPTGVRIKEVLIPAYKKVLDELFRKFDSL